MDAQFLMCPEEAPGLADAAWDMLHAVEAADATLEKIHALTHERMRDVRHIIHALSEPWHKDHGAHPIEQSRKVRTEYRLAPAASTEGPGLMWDLDRIDRMVDDAESIKLNQLPGSVKDCYEDIRMRTASLRAALTRSVEAKVEAGEPTPLEHLIGAVADVMEKHAYECECDKCRRASKLLQAVSARPARKKE